MAASKKVVVLTVRERVGPDGRPYVEVVLENSQWVFREENAVFGVVEKTPRPRRRKWRDVIRPQGLFEKQAFEALKGAIAQLKERTVPIADEVVIARWTGWVLSVS